MALEFARLQVATHTFRLLHHRNKNQHRRSKWWKWFSMLKRCVSKLLHEIQVRDNARAQARVKHMNRVVLPKCYASFTQLIQDTQFSTLGLTLVAELSRLRSLVAYYVDRVATELVASKDTFPLHLSEDIGEAVGRNPSSNPTDVGMHSGVALDRLTASERGKEVEKRPHGKEGAGLDATKPAIGEIGSPQRKAAAAIAGFKSYASLAPVKKQRQRKSVNVIDDLFQGLY